MDFADIRDEEEDGGLQRRPSCLLGLVRLLLVLLVPLLVVAALIPTLLSSDAGRQWALKRVNGMIAPAAVSVERWSLGWFTAPVLENVAYLDPERGADVGALSQPPSGRLGLPGAPSRTGEPAAPVRLSPPARADPS